MRGTNSVIIVLAGVLDYSGIRPLGDQSWVQSETWSLHSSFSQYWFGYVLVTLEELTFHRTTEITDFHNKAFHGRQQIKSSVGNHYDLTLRPKQNNRHVAAIFQCMSSNETCLSLFVILLKFVPRDPTEHNSALVKVISLAANQCWLSFMIPYIYNELRKNPFTNDGFLSRHSEETSHLNRMFQYLPILWYRATRGHCCGRVLKHMSPEL